VIKPDILPFEITFRFYGINLRNDQPEFLEALLKDF